jgi:hypothetical protein
MGNLVNLRSGYNKIREQAGAGLALRDRVG